MFTAANISGTIKYSPNLIAWELDTYKDTLSITFDFTLQYLQL